MSENRKTHDDGYVTDDEYGNNWHLMLGDSCERLKELAAESIDLSVCSPPFASLYTYTQSLRDLSNSFDLDTFLAHYRFIVAEQLRVTKPGRMACIHLQNLRLSTAFHGRPGMRDLRGRIIELFEDVGWWWWGEVTVWKDPQIAAIRTKSPTLGFAPKNKDSTKVAPTQGDYCLMFKKPGENAVPVTHEADTGEMTNADWIEWAAPIWFDRDDDEGRYGPVWTTVRETDVLNSRLGKEDADTRHNCPLQLEFIRRCIFMFSNRGETILSPFGGVGSEPYVAVKHGRKAIACELKESYFNAAVSVMRELDTRMAEPKLFN